jgi:diguanylate cyclase (GGDEF)-like protein
MTFPSTATRTDSPDALAPQGAGSPDARPHILIVDDIGDNRAILARRFERRGFQITEADCGMRAIELVDSGTFDVVLLDVMMPDIDGVEVLRQIRSRHASAVLPVIMVTARVQSDDIVSALELGADDYITKPVDFAVAMARVNTQVARRRAEMQALQSAEAVRKSNEVLEKRVIERTSQLVLINEQLKTEIQHREKSEAQSKYLACHDALTGLANRVLFRDGLDRALLALEETGAGMAVLFIDLDGFKSVNDTLGHSVGDTLLKVIASRLRDILADEDLIARLGGDEFAILQRSGGQPNAATALASQIIETVSAICTIDGNEITVGASVGIAVCDSHETDPEDLLRNADLAMYRAKADGRGMYRLFDPAMDERAQARRQLELDMRRALAVGDFKLFFQPIVNLHSKKVACLEALVRMEHPTRGMVSPLEFIPAAEETGLIVPIGEWVIREACMQAAAWPDSIRVAVNLSSVQFMRGNIVSSVVSSLAASGLSAERLELEITESVLLEKTDRNLAILNQLRELGVRIAMDDFGTGYSSLGYLRSFRFDKIKIDQSFIKDSENDRESRGIIAAIASLGTTFGMKTTAEGVETQEQLDMVTDEGCTEVQGYFFSRPVPACDVSALLARLDCAQDEKTTVTG